MFSTREIADEAGCTSEEVRLWVPRKERQKVNGKYLITEAGREAALRSAATERIKEKAKSKAAWRKHGRKLKPGATPCGQRKLWRCPAYPIYNEDQTIPIKRRQPLTPRESIH